MSLVAIEEPNTRDPREVEVTATIRMLSKWLPEQRPLSVFVHANPLEALEHHHFHAACEAATRIRGARTTLCAERYRELMAERHIRPEDVAASRTRLEEMRLARVDLLPTAPDTVLLSRVRPEMAGEIGEMVDAVLLRVLPPFLDLGSAMWPMPGRNEGLLSVLRSLSRGFFGMPEPWLSGLSQRLGASETRAMSLIVECLEKRDAAPMGWPSVLHEALFALPGYAGMIHRLEHHPHEQPSGVKVSLEDYLAARLVIEELALEDVTRRLFGRRATLAKLAASLTPTSAERAVPWSEDLAAFQDAFEEDYVRSLVGAMSMTRLGPAVADGPIDVHYVSCIDDRLESIRRHIEECVPRSETIGCAGFFGIALKHRAPLDVDETPSCPAIVTPTKRVSEVLDPTATAVLDARRVRTRLFGAIMGDDASRSPVGGALASLASLVRAPMGALELLFPQLFVEEAHDFEGTRLVLSNEEDAEGFSPDERIDLVHRTLSSIGLTHGFGRWVLIVAHGSKGVNNPFLSGYQCGACGGQRGGINARVFCAFANDAAVREGLAKRGIVIPARTRFQPGEHDTALDHIRWFDEDELTPVQRAGLTELDAKLGVALARNAKERARRFEDVPLSTSIDETLERVRRRTADFAETRPEYNHATNASCIIGRRSLTRGLFLDRRAFLISYDPTTDDPRHGTLERAMAAPLPVCAGISLEYFFATMDPERFGSGTKLPHNVQGLLGVSNGADGDLRPGLWTQTTEIHEPLRLVTIIEAEPEAIAEVLERLPAVKRTVVNGWVHLFACSPADGAFSRWVGEGFEPYAALPHALYEVRSSLDACAHTRGNVAPCVVMSGSGDDLDDAVHGDAGKPGEVAA